MLFSNIRTCSQGQYLYKKGDQNALGFFFVLKGRIEILVLPSDKE